MPPKKLLPNIQPDIQLLREHLHALVDDTLGSEVAQISFDGAHAALKRLSAAVDEIGAAHPYAPQPVPPKKRVKLTRTKRTKAAAQLTIRLPDGTIQHLAGSNALFAQCLIDAKGGCVSIQRFAKGFNLRSRAHDLRKKFNLKIESVRVQGMPSRTSWWASAKSRTWTLPSRSTLETLRSLSPRATQSQPVERSTSAALVGYL